MMRMVQKVDLAGALIVAGASLLLAGAGCSNPQERPATSSADLDAIRAADKAYVTGWLRNEPEQVMATLTEDAVLIPSGLPVLEGADAIREFWWPVDSPTTTVTEFNLLQQEVGGNGDFGFARGSFALGFEYDGKTYLNEGDYLSLLRRLPDSSWRISHRMWNDHSPQTD